MSLRLVECKMILLSQNNGHFLVFMNHFKRWMLWSCESAYNNWWVGLGLVACH